LRWRPRKRITRRRRRRRPGASQCCPVRRVAGAGAVEGGRWALARARPGSGVGACAVGRKAGALTRKHAAHWQVTLCAAQARTLTRGAGHDRVCARNARAAGGPQLQLELASQAGPQVTRPLATRGRRRLVGRACASAAGGRLVTDGRCCHGGPPTGSRPGPRVGHNRMRVIRVVGVGCLGRFSSYLTHWQAGMHAAGLRVGSPTMLVSVSPARATPLRRSRTPQRSR
jgi:hypothetical protein